MFKPFETSSSWEFIDPDTNYNYKSDSLANLIRLIVTYRSNNQLEPISHLNIVVENYLCGLPCNTGKCIPKKLERGLLQYLKGGVALVENLMYKAFVNQDTANKRAEMCSECPCNIFPDKNAFIRWSDAIALHSVGERKSYPFDTLGNCEGCSCILKAKVHYPGPFKLTDEEKEVMIKCNPTCWQLQEL